MDGLLFPGFLADDDIYRAAEQFWAKLVEETVGAVQTGDRWDRWMPQTYGNGMSLMPRDGNPIFDARSPDRTRGIRITQFEPEPGDNLLDGWITQYPDDRDPEIPTAELALDVAATEETTQRVRDLIRVWVSPGITPERMNRELDQVLGRNVK